jgi:uncharacterized lipoprotein YehR (DUF1307 family)
MNCKVLKTAALIFVVLIMIFSLSGCDRMKAQIGFKWGQIQKNDPYRVVKNSQKEMAPVMRIEQNKTIAIDSGTAVSRPAKHPVRKICFKSQDRISLLISG